MNIQYKDLRDLLKSELSNLVTTPKQSCSFVKITKPKQLVFPTVNNTAGGTHPSVKHFPNGWSGYKFWMAYTPYPDVAYENPVIVCSEDGENWVTPSGLVNPIAPQPATGYNSDTELVFVNGKRLRCYWRWYTKTSGDNVLRYKESADGVTWGAIVDCILPAGTDPLSPCIYVDRGNNYVMWLGAGYGGDVKKLTSTDGITWDGIVECKSNVEGYGYHWHPYVWKEVGAFFCLSCVVTNEVITGYNMGDLYLGKSVDGINWEYDTNPVFARGEDGIKKYRVYRSCAVRVGNSHYLYISGLGSESEQIHLVEALLQDS